MYNHIRTFASITTANPNANQTSFTAKTETEDVIGSEGCSTDPPWSPLDSQKA